VNKHIVCCCCLMDRVSGIKYEDITKLVSYEFDSDTFVCMKQHKKSQGGFL